MANSYIKKFENTVYSCLENITKSFISFIKYITTQENLPKIKLEYWSIYKRKKMSMIITIELAKIIIFQSFSKNLIFNLKYFELINTLNNKTLKQNKM